MIPVIPSVTDEVTSLQAVVIPQSFDYLSTQAIAPDQKLVDTTLSENNPLISHPVFSSPTIDEGQLTLPGVQPRGFLVPDVHLPQSRGAKLCQRWFSPQAFISLSREDAGPLRLPEICFGMPYHTVLNLKL